MKSIVAAFFVFSYSFVTPAIFADELPETVISASRSEELLVDSPYSGDVIGADELLGGLCCPCLRR